MHALKWLVDALTSISTQPHVWAAMGGAAAASIAASRLAARSRLRNFPGNPVFVIGQGGVSQALLSEPAIVPKELIRYCNLAMVRMMLMPQSRGQVGGDGRAKQLLLPGRLIVLNNPHTVIVPVVDSVDSYEAAKQQRYAEIDDVRDGLDLVERRLMMYSKENVTGIEIIGAPDRAWRGRGFTAVSCASVYRNIFTNIYSRCSVLLIVNDAVG